MSDTIIDRNSNDLKRNAAALHKALPDVMQAQAKLMRSVGVDGALSARIKELMALSISVVERCGPCIAFHVENALLAGASRAEVAETIGVAIEMGGGPAVVYGGKALEIFDNLALPRRLLVRRAGCSFRGALVYQTRSITRSTDVLHREFDYALHRSSTMESRKFSCRIAAVCIWHTLGNLFSWQMDVAPDSFEGFRCRAPTSQGPTGVLGRPTDVDPT